MTRRWRLWRATGYGVLVGVVLLPCNPELATDLVTLPLWVADGYWEQIVWIVGELIGWLSGPMLLFIIIAALRNWRVRCQLRHQFQRALVERNVS